MGSSNAGSSGAVSPHIGFSRADWRLIGFAVLAAAATGVAHYANLGGTIAPFVVSALGLALLASLVGRSVEALGARLGRAPPAWSRARWEICPSCSWCCSR
jgi:hypothetical protein